MSLRTVQRIGLMGVLGLSSIFAAACGDDDKKETANDAGGDGDGDTGGAKDAGSDAGPMLGVDDVTCAGATGEIVCKGQKIIMPPNLKACCLGDTGAQTCGLMSTLLTGPNAPAVCVPRDAPGVASVGAGSCTQVWDSVDFADENLTKADAGIGDNMTDGKFTRQVSKMPPIATNFDGCCTAAGTCSINFKTVNVVISGNVIPAAQDIGYGCADPAIVGLSAASIPAGFGDTISCDPATGMLTEQPVSPGDAGTP